MTRKSPIEHRHLQSGVRARSVRIAVIVGDVCVTPAVPDIRIRLCNSARVRRDGEFVLYWMIAQRRATWNFALQRAADWAEQLDRPLIVLEALRCNYRWASDRLHGFIIDGMRDNAAAFRGTRAAYHAYVEPERGAGMGLLEALMERACLVVTDDFPCFFLPGMVARVARSAPVCVEAVDSNGLLPLGKTYGRNRR